MSTLRSGVQDDGAVDGQLCATPAIANIAHARGVAHFAVTAAGNSPDARVDFGKDTT